MERRQENPHVRRLSYVTWSAPPFSKTAYKVAQPTDRPSVGGCCCSPTLQSIVCVCCEHTAAQATRCLLPVSTSRSLHSIEHDGELNSRIMCGISSLLGRTAVVNDALCWRFDFEGSSASSLEELCNCQVVVSIVTTPTPYASVLRVGLQCVDMLQLAPFL